MRELSKEKYKIKKEHYLMINLYRLIIHIDEVVLFDLGGDHKNNQDLRYKYLLDEIDDDEFGRILFKREIRNLKRMAMHDLYHSFNIIAKDLLSRYFDEMNFDNFNSNFFKCYDEIKKCSETIISNYGGRLKHFESIEQYHYYMMKRNF
jgi:hypothetical protein